jgi:hypothetical protein
MHNRSMMAKNKENCLERRHIYNGDLEVNDLIMS